jgi:carbonic anhydrase
MLRFACRTAVFASVLAAVVTVAQQTATPPHWSYDGDEGPAHWGDLDPSFASCKAGHSQSPIDIRGAESAHLDALQFDYHEVPLHILDNGHTISVPYPPGSTLTVGGHAYTLKQFHFHHPSEEKIDGRGADMVIHFVHADAQGQLAVVALLLNQGAANATLEKIWQHLPQEKGKESAVESVSVDAASLLPAQRGYYTFAGSLTTPPCTEGVTWYVLRQTAALSSEQLAAFGKIYPLNARPTQPTGGRAIRKSE